MTGNGAEIAPYGAQNLRSAAHVENRAGEAGKIRRGKAGRAGAMDRMRAGLTRL